MFVFTQHLEGYSLGGETDLEVSFGFLLTRFYLWNDPNFEDLDFHRFNHQLGFDSPHQTKHWESPILLDI